MRVLEAWMQEMMEEIREWEQIIMTLLTNLLSILFMNSSSVMNRYALRNEKVFKAAMNYYTASFPSP